jgi:copper(I)-binding protein
LLVGCSRPPDALVVANAFIRLPVPGRDVLVGYFDLHNGTASSVTILGAHSPSARAIELHTMIADGDMMRMRPLKTLTLAPGERVSFAPGGHHLMIFGATAQAGQSINITFEFEDGSHHAATFEVRPFEGAKPS